MAATSATTTATTNAPADAATTATQKSQNPRARIARQILIYHFALIGASCIYYLLRGFDFEEFTTLMGILGPITAMYGGAVFRYIGRNLADSTTNGNGNGAKVSISAMVRWLVHGHFAIVMTLISLKAFTPNILSFQDMVIFLTLVESALGVYMGNIILALFEPQQQAKTPPQA